MEHIACLKFDRCSSNNDTAVQPCVHWFKADRDMLYLHIDLYRFIQIAAMYMCIYVCLRVFVCVWSGQAVYRRRLPWGVGGGPPLGAGNLSTNDMCEKTFKRIHKQWKPPPNLCKCQCVHQSLNTVYHFGLAMLTSLWLHWNVCKLTKFRGIFAFECDEI